jgi:hypothetical protein
VRVVATDELRTHLESHGGVLYVRTRSTRCCSGPLTTLEATTDPPADPEAYRRIIQDTFTLALRSTGRPDPDELVLTLEGRRRPHPCAYWNGSALVL